MIIWQGFGWLIAVFCFGCLMITEMCVNGAMHDRNYYETHGWPKLLGFWIAAGVSWPLGRSMSREAQQKATNPETGKAIVIPSQETHTLFFIPVQYWWAVFLVLGVVFSVD